MQPSVHEVARGRWPGILSAAGLDDKSLTGRHTACPICGGKDRFRFDDKNGTGSYFCNSCGAGSGVDLYMALRGLGFAEAAREIEAAAGSVRPHITKTQSEAEKVETLNRVWSESSPLTGNDEASRYLRNRGVSVAGLSAALRIHPSLYCQEARTRYPAMLARIADVRGNGLSIHRTYLHNGQKAPVQSPKKIMPGKGITGGAVQLFDHTGCLGIAEGIETAIAARALFSVPVWSCISAGGMESFEPPAGISRLIIFADHDANHVGAKSAYACAHRLSMAGLSVTVHMPNRPGDWLDVLNSGREAA